jgi:hypothetical protein
MKSLLEYNKVCRRLELCESIEHLLSSRQVLRDRQGEAWSHARCELITEMTLAISDARRQLALLEDYSRE